MASGTPKRHHYVPQMILRNFTDAERRLFFCKEKPGPVCKTGPGNLFCENRLYTLQGDWEEGDPLRSEKSLGTEIEAEAAPVFRKILHAVRQRRNPSLSLEQCQACLRFLWTSAHRTPDQFEQIIIEPDVTGMSSMVDDSFREHCSRNYPPETMALCEKLIEELACTRNEVWEIFRHNARVHLASASLPHICEWREKFVKEYGLNIGYVDKQSSGLVIGSSPVAIICDQEEQNPTWKTWLPISHDIAISNSPQTNSVSIGRLKSEQIERINRTIYEESRIVAGHSEEILLVLAEMYLRSKNSEPDKAS